MYSLTQEVLKGANIIAALQNYPNMPGVDAVFSELDYFAECVQESEKFYGVPFKRQTSNDSDEVRCPKDQFDVVSDVKGHFEEFYFGGSQEITFGFRPRAYYRLIVEPLLDSMSHLSHDEILDFAPNVVEQIKEQIAISAYQNKLDAVTAYKMYRHATTERQQEKRIKEITAGVMKLRRKTIALQREINRQKKS